MAFAPNGRLVLVNTGAVIRTIIAGRNPNSVTLTPDNRHLYIVLDGERAIAKIDAATDRIEDTFGVAGAGHRALLSKLRLSGTASAVAPGQRFPPEQPDRRRCDI